MKYFALLAASLGLLAGSIPTAARSTETPRLVVLPSHATVYELRVWGAGPHPEWTEAARSNLAEAWREAAANSPHFLGVSLEDLTHEEHEAVVELQRLVMAIVYRSGWNLVPGAKSRTAVGIEPLGPSLAFLADRTGAEEAIGVVALQAEMSKAAVGMNVAFVAGSFLLPGWIGLPSVSGVRLAAFAVHLRTGQLRWLAGSHAPEIGGANLGDLRDPQSVRKLIAATQRHFPESAAEPLPPPAKVPMSPARRMPRMSPHDGLLAVRPVEGWSFTSSARSVESTQRRSRPFVRMEFVVREHGQAFQAVGVRTRPSTRPAQLLEWFAADLLEQQLPELRIVEDSTDARLADQAAFRIRYVYRPWQEAPLIEAIVTGTATRDGLMLATLTAPHLGLFDATLADYEATIGSVITRIGR